MNSFLMAGAGANVPSEMQVAEVGLRRSIARRPIPTAPGKRLVLRRPTTTPGIRPTPTAVTTVGKKFNGKRFVYVAHQRRAIPRARAKSAGPSDEGERNNLAAARAIEFDMPVLSFDPAFTEAPYSPGGYQTNDYGGAPLISFGGGLHEIGNTGVYFPGSTPGITPFNTNTTTSSTGHSTRDTVAGLINNGLGLLGNIFGRQQPPQPIQTVTPPVNNGAGVGSNVGATAGGLFDGLAASLGVSPSTFLLMGGAFVFAIFFMGPSRGRR